MGSPYSCERESPLCPGQTPAFANLPGSETLPCCKLNYPTPFILGPFAQPGCSLKCGGRTAPTSVIFLELFFFKTDVTL